MEGIDDWDKTASFRVGAAARRSTSSLGGHVNENLYAPPNAHVADAEPVPPNHRHYYTPWQVCVATILAGPLGGGYFFFRNHQLFGNRQKATRAVLVSGFLLIALTGLGLLMRKGGSGTALAGAVAGMYRWFASDAFNSEITKRKVEGWTSASWWRVIGLSIAMLAGLLLCAIVLLVVARKVVSQSST